MAEEVRASSSTMVSSERGAVGVEAWQRDSEKFLERSCAGLDQTEKTLLAHKQHFVLQKLSLRT